MGHLESITGCAWGCRPNPGPARCRQRFAFQGSTCGSKGVPPLPSTSTQPEPLLCLWQQLQKAAATPPPPRCEQDQGTPNCSSPTGASPMLEEWCFIPLPRDGLAPPKHGMRRTLLASSSRGVMDIPWVGICHFPWSWEMPWVPAEPWISRSSRKLGQP